MTTEMEIRNERVDDLPLLIALQQRMGIGEVIDEVIAPHWRQQGISVGQTAEIWLAFILSEADHRLSYVEPWVARHEETLKQGMATALRAQEFNDDRLGDVLRYLSEDASWTAIERELSERLMRVYRLPQACVRLDSTTVSVYYDPEGMELIRWGRPWSPKWCPGNRADDELYIPAIDQARRVVGQPGLLYIGDNKMEALSTRAHLVVGGDYSLTPLSLKGEQADLLAQLVQPLLDEKQDGVTVYREPAANQEAKLIASGYESSQHPEMQVGDEWVQWTERLLVVHSPGWAKRAKRGLQGR